MSLTKLATALTVIFVISLVSLIAELLFVLWRRQVFRRHTPPSNTIHNQHQHSSTPDQSPTVISSKEQLLFFLCLRTQSQINPTVARSDDQNGSSPDNNDSVIDVFKLLNGLHGPSRVLCTIKEEEREGIESDDSATKPKRVCLQACFEVNAAGDTAVEEVAVTTVEEEKDDDEDEMTPFSTPCASPAYFTPLASPSHEIEFGTDALTEKV